MKTQIDQNTINDAVWAACDGFRSVVDPSIYKDYVLTILFLKFVSDVWQDHYDNYKKEHGDEPELIAELLKTERFTLPSGASFYDLFNRREEPGNGERFNEALHAIEESNINKLRDVFQDIDFNSNKLGDEKQKNGLLKQLLEDFSDDDLNLRPSRVGNLDVIGNAYEFLIKRFAATAGKKAGEFYTPPEVSDLISTIIDPQVGDQICDPTCGSGSLLMKCGRKVQENNNGSKNYELYGQEAIGSTWALAKMNMFLHGEDNHRIEWGDTLRTPKLLDKNDNLMLFDVVVANPPFSLDKWGHEELSNDPRFHRGLPPKTKADFGFILHMIETLKPKSGRMGVVVPHGVLFRGASEGKIRKKLVEENLLEAVIGLPEKLFYGTGIPAVILIFKKVKNDKRILFIEASREYQSGKNQNILTGSNIEKIISTYRKRLTSDKYSYLATSDEIANNDFNLNIPRYVDTFEEDEEIDLISVKKERDAIKSKLEELDKKMEGHLEALGFNS